MRSKTPPIFINDDTIGMNSYGNNIFIHFDGVLVFSLAIEKLLKPGHLVINDFLLRFQLGFKNHIAILVAHGWHWPLAKRVDVNTEAVPQLA